MALVVLLIIDRVAVASVERDLANRIAAVPSFSGTSAVSIEGIPFLTQAVSGRYPEVRQVRTAAASDPPRGLNIPDQA